MTGYAVRVTGGGYFLASLALLGAWLTLPSVAPGRAAAAYLAAAAGLAALLIGSLVMHEIGHAAAARRRGATAGVITVGFFGGTAHGSYEGREQPGPRGQWRVAAAGPAASLAFAAVLAAGALGLTALGVDRLGALVLACAAVANAAIGVLSLLPGAGPDGGRIVRALTWARTGDPAKAGLVAARAGQVTGALLAGAGFTIIALGFLAGLWVALIGILAFATSRSQARRVLTATALAGLRVADIVPLSTPPAAGVPAWQTVEAFLAGQPARTSFPLHDFEGRPAGLLTLSQVAAVPAGRRADVRLRDIATPLAHLVTTTPDEYLTSLLERVSAWPRVPAAGHTAGHVLVLGPDGTPAAVLTPADLAGATQVGALRQNAAAASQAAGPVGGPPRS